MPWKGLRAEKNIFYGRTWDLEGLVEVSDIGDGILASKQAVVSRFPSALNYKWENRKNKNAHASYPFFIGFHSWPPCVLSPWLRRDHLFHPNALPLVVVTFQRWLESPNFNNFPQTCPSGYCQTFGETFFFFLYSSWLLIVATNMDFFLPIRGTFSMGGRSRLGAGDVGAVGLNNPVGNKPVGISRKPNSVV